MEKGWKKYREELPAIQGRKTPLRVRTLRRNKEQLVIGTNWHTLKAVLDLLNAVWAKAQSQGF